MQIQISEDLTACPSSLGPQTEHLLLSLPSPSHGLNQNEAELEQVLTSQLQLKYKAWC